MKPLSCAPAAAAAAGSYVLSVKKSSMSTKSAAAMQADSKAVRTFLRRFLRRVKAAS